jgi:methyl-accepting chemotaxis protein
MPGWIGPTIAISLLLMALCTVGLTLAALVVFREVLQGAKGVSSELQELRAELGPMIRALNRFGEAGTEVVDIARQEIREVVAASQDLRADIRRARRRAGRRLADLDAFVEVMQEEIEETGIAAATAMRSLRAGGGVAGQVGRMLVSRRRSKR